MRAFLGWFSLVAAIAFASAVSAADLPGAKDPSFLKRFQGAEIVHYLNLPYESLTIWSPDPKNPTANWVATSAEGQVTRILYHLPSGHTVLEVLRNYEQTFRQLGLTVITEHRGDRDFAYYTGTAVYGQSWEARNYDWTQLGIYGMTDNAYVTAKGTVNSKPVTIALWVGLYNGPRDSQYEQKVHFNSDQPVVLLDVVTAKDVVNQMVLVKAAYMADALASKGFIDLYGVYFDTDKTEVKPESNATLDEIASLLKIDRSLKLEISGHTDNTGAKDHNLKLSQGRADAVKAVLVSKYGIDGARLSAKGYGDTKPVAPNTSEANKAKNRRVELRKV